MKATQSEIKTSYYALAQKYHPDKNSSDNAKEKFHDISRYSFYIHITSSSSTIWSLSMSSILFEPLYYSTLYSILFYSINIVIKLIKCIIIKLLYNFYNSAYETLSDEQKRSTYNLSGMTSDEQIQDNEDPYEEYEKVNKKKSRKQRFEESEGFFRMGGDMMGKTEPERGADILLNMEISFMEAVTGTKKDLLYQKKGFCIMCKGSGCKDGSKPVKCPKCRGSGISNYRQGPMTLQMSCVDCGGRGIMKNNICSGCKSKGIGNIQATEEITIPRGIAHGRNLKKPGKVINIEDGQ